MRQRYSHGKTLLLCFINAITPTQLLGKNDVDGKLVKRTCNLVHVTRTKFWRNFVVDY